MTYAYAIRPHYMEDPKHHANRVRDIDLALAKVRNNPKAAAHNEAVSTAGLKSLFAMPTGD